MLETRMVSLGREIDNARAAIAAIRTSLDSPAVQALGLHGPVIGRIAALEQRAGVASQQIVVLQQELIAARSKEKTADELSARISSVTARRAEEVDSLETLAAMRGVQPAARGE
jgi:hypothetical protein